MEHEEQKDPVAQSTSAHSTTSAVDLSDRDNKETLVVKEEEPNPKTEKLLWSAGQTKSVVEDKQQVCSARASGAGKWELELEMV